MTATAADLQLTIEEAWERRDSIDPTDGALKEAVEAAILRLDSGEERVAEKTDGQWRVNQWLKKAVLLSFRLNPMEAIPGGPGGAPWWDKVPSKFFGWTADSFAKAGFRAVPGAIVTIHAPGIANADVCVSGGRRISVSGCANIADAVAPYIPPPAYYAPMPYDPPPPPNVSGCVSYNGRWVNASSCN